MTGPDLDRDLAAIGRRLSPRLGRAQEAVVGRASGSAGRRAHRPRPPRAPSRLGGAMLTLAVSAAFGTLLAVGVATRPSPDGPPAGHGPSVAMATGTPTIPDTTGSSGGEATPAPSAPGPADTPPAVIGGAPTRPGPAATAPSVPAGDPVFTMPAPSGRPASPQPTAAATAEASTAATPTENPTPAAGPTGAAPTAPPRFASPTAPAPTRWVLTEKDGGRTITVHAGDVVEVDLTRPQDGSQWTVPQTTDRTVVKPSSKNSTTDGSAPAVFTVPGKKGSASIQASKVPACATATPRCLPPQRIDFTVTIVVA